MQGEVAVFEAIECCECVCVCVCVATHLPIPILLFRTDYRKAKGLEGT